ncbi:hypothetical protein GCM10009092_35050 [Bowmanella denitrificans]|uniref:Uncharacterized protein n=1 Tax=Bowmanella denitrificans TaxID=366582 RepID=A0ABP3HEG3_9ALTE
MTTALMILFPVLINLLFIKVFKLKRFVSFLLIFILGYLVLFPVEMLYCFFVELCQEHSLRVVGVTVYYTLIVVFSILAQFVIDKFFNKKLSGDVKHT